MSAIPVAGTPFPAHLPNGEVDSVFKRITWFRFGTDLLQPRVREALRARRVARQADFWANVAAADQESWGPTWLSPPFYGKRL